MYLSSSIDEEDLRALWPDEPVGIGQTDTIMGYNLYMTTGVFIKEARNAGYYRRDWLNVEHRLLWSLSLKNLEL